MAGVVLRGEACRGGNGGGGTQQVVGGDGGGGGPQQAGGFGGGFKNTSCRLQLQRGRDSCQRSGCRRCSPRGLDSGGRSSPCCCSRRSTSPLNCQCIHLGSAQRCSQRRCLSCSSRPCTQRKFPLGRSTWTPTRTRQLECIGRSTCRRGGRQGPAGWCTYSRPPLLPRWRLARRWRKRRPRKSRRTSPRSIPCNLGRLPSRSSQERSSCSKKSPLYTNTTYRCTARRDRRCKLWPRLPARSCRRSMPCSPGRLPSRFCQQRSRCSRKSPSYREDSSYRCTARRDRRCRLWPRLPARSCRRSMPCSPGRLPSRFCQQRRFLVPVYCPAGQEVHAVNPLSEYLPAGQEEQESAPGVDDDSPAAQLEQYVYPDHW